EKAIIETKNRLIDMGIEIIEDSDALVHVSGHPRRTELREMYQWTRPQIGVPVHGEAAHLSAHAKLMREAQVPDVMDARNGDIVKLAPGNPEIIGDVPHGQIYKDGMIVGDEGQTGVGERRRLSFAGHVAVSIVLDKNLEIATEPQVVAIGIPLKDVAGEDFEDQLYEAVVGAIESMPRSRRKDLDTVEDGVSRAIRAKARDLWGKKPLTTVLVDRV
ncbi:MAG: MBL fold metallo-hydrolase RNA specificity domain-containing protein, partial [Pseudomonadota bacterium]